MSVQILVRDQYGRPIQKAKVFVWWEGSTSKEETNSLGVADLRCSGGIIKQIKVNGHEVFNGKTYVSDNQTYPVTLDR